MACNVPVSWAVCCIGVDYLGEQEQGVTRVGRWLSRASFQTSWGGLRVWFGDGSLMFVHPIRPSVLITLLEMRETSVVTYVRVEIAQFYASIIFSTRGANPRNLSDARTIRPQQQFW